MLAKKAKEVLQTFQEAGILKDLVLIGSWCCHFYISYFGRAYYVPSIQTLDLDLLIPDHRSLQRPISVDDLLKTIEFESEHTYSGWLRFIHPDLRVEFLVPRLGPQADDPKSIPSLKINAMPLRHTFPLTANLIRIEEGELSVRVPHPIAFALHKLLISGRRQDKKKAPRDKEMAFRILDAVQQTGRSSELPTIWSSFTKKEKAEVLCAIEKEGRADLIGLGLTK